MGGGRSNDPELTVVPANEVEFDDLQAVFGTRGQAALCQCQRYKLRRGETFAGTPVEERAFRLRSQTDCGNSDAATTSGLVAWVADEPVGWCAVEPRTAYPVLARSSPVPWRGRAEDKADASVWAVTCVFVRTGHRRREISRGLVTAAVGFARDRGARALEGYPMTRSDVISAELHVGALATFIAAGFTEVSRPTQRRAVVRIDF
ncbi:MAG: GNAT family N-acetyltransferase [Propionibacteriaceae bacterium]